MKLLFFLPVIFASQLYASQVSKTALMNLSAEIKTVADREEKVQAEQPQAKELPHFLHREHTKLMQQLMNEDKLTDAVKRKTLGLFARLKKANAIPELQALREIIQAKHHMLFLSVADQESPELLDLSETEALTCQTFQELLDEQIKHHDPLIIARVTDDSHHVYYFDADTFNRYRYDGYPLTDENLAAPSKLNNPLNRQAIRQVNYFAYMSQHPEWGFVWKLSDADFSREDKRYFKYWLMAHQNSDKKSKIDALKELFFVAAIANDLEFIKNAIAAPGCNLNVQSSVGNTALIIAAISENPQAIKMLLEGGADPYIKNDSGFTLYDFVKNKPALGHVVKEFYRQKMLKQQASEPIQPRKATALEEKMIDDALQSELTETKLQAYLKKGADISARNIIDTTALSNAADQNDENEIMLLLKYGAYVDTRDKFGHTPLITAATNGKDKLVNLLLLHGAQVNAQDYTGITALMRASTKPIIIMLLNAGANPFLSTYDAATITKNYQTIFKDKTNKERADSWKNRSFFTLRAKILNDPAIQEALAHNPYVIQEQAVLGNQLRQETPLPQQLINIITQYKGIEEPDKKKEQKEVEWCVIT